LVEAARCGAAAPQPTNHGQRAQRTTMNRGRDRANRDRARSV